MLMGRTNDPLLPLAEEIQRTAALGFGFLDLGLEPPESWPVDVAAVSRALAESGLATVGHTAPYLPIAAGYKQLREGAGAVAREAIDRLAAIGAKVVSVHPDTHSLPRRRVGEVRDLNADAVARLAEHASSCGIKLALENTPEFGRVEDIGAVLAVAPDVGFHLDVGHANLRPCGGPATAVALLSAFGRRLVHVQVHDNAGGTADRHLPPGAGTIDWPQTVRAIRGQGYDGTVTLEVFTGVDDLLDARDTWQGWWDAAHGDPS